MKRIERQDGVTQVKLQFLSLAQLFNFPSHQKLGSSGLLALLKVC